MKKVVLFSLMVITLFTSFGLNAQAEVVFRIDITTKDTTFVDGVKYQKIVGSINYDGTVSNQVIHYLGANPTTDDSIHMVVGDNYWDYSTPTPSGWGMSNLPIIADEVESRYENYEVLGGVNGDFYDINNTGKPTEAHIIDYNVIYQGATSSRPIAAFFDDGSTLFAHPTYDGLDLFVQNDESANKGQFDIEQINALPSEDGISVYFDNWDAEIPAGYQKLIVAATRTAYDGSATRYFGKGILDIMTSDAYTVDDHEFVIVCGQNFSDEGLINIGDQLVVQQNATGDFENARFGIGVYETLVKDGVMIDSWTSGAALGFRAPRTAIGVKADGTVFFVLVDGRQFDKGMEGVTHWELAEIMAYFDAVDAYNLDGGGSSTMITVNEENTGYLTMNSPSDGHLRSVSNGIFFVKGELIPRVSDVPFPDTRIQLANPNSLYVDEGIIHFSEVPGADAYYVSINGVEHYTSTTQYILPSLDGVYDIKVRARGNDQYQTSEYSESFTYYQTSGNMANILDFFEYLAQGRKS